MESEILRTRLDGNASKIPREGQRRREGGAPRGPSLWCVRPAVDLPLPEPVYGAYPKGFLHWALRAMHVRSERVLHVCSGSLPPETPGIRLDLRAAARPCVQADGCALPFGSDVFDAVLLDPPYSVELTEALYPGVDYPRPSHLLAEAGRVVRPRGSVGILHFLVPMTKPPLEFVTVYGITTGAGYRIRAFTVLRKTAQQTLL